MPRMKIIDELVTNNLLLFNKGIKIQDCWVLKTLIVATKMNFYIINCV